MATTMERADEQDLADLPWAITDRAIARFLEAARERGEAYRLAGGRAEFEPWTDLATQAAIEAERHLVLAILAYDPGYGGPRRHRADRRRWEPRGARSGGRLYVAYPGPDRDEDLEGIPADLDGPMLMRLVVVDESRVVDLDAPGAADVAARSATVVDAGAGEDARWTA